MEISRVLATNPVCGDWRYKIIEIGRICVKIAGRDAGLKCVVIDILDKNYVLIDGETRRRKCNILHLEPLKEVIKIKKNASHEEMKKEFEKLGLKARETKPKEKKEKPTKVRKKKEISEDKTKKQGKLKESKKKKTEKKKDSKKKPKSPEKN